MVALDWAGTRLGGYKTRPYVWQHRNKGFNMTDSETNNLAEMTIEELLRRWPETAVIFHNHHMACPGCAVASFYTLTDAANVYGLPPEELIAEIQNAITAIDD